MRLPRIRFTIRWMMCLVAILAVASCAYARYQRWTYYDSGWWEAESELWRGDVTIYAPSGYCSDDECNIDRATGLPICRVGYYRYYRVGDEQRTKGHNDHIAQYIRWHGVPKKTFKAWETELFNVERFFEGQSRIEAPKPLTAQSPELVSPDPTYRVRLVRDLSKPDGGWWNIFITAGDVVHHDSSFVFGDPPFHLVWGPEGSRFAVIRSITSYGADYLAYDLATGRMLSWRRDAESQRKLRP
jgi:hypothetical protein